MEKSIANTLFLKSVVSGKCVILLIPILFWWFYILCI